jgi:hypothetical protein
MLILIIVLVLLLGSGGGYYGHSRWATAAVRESGWAPYC